MASRVPYTDPLTVKEHVGLAAYRTRLWWFRLRHERLWWWVAFHLPRKVVLFAFVRVMAAASTRIEHGTRHPDSITYGEAYKAWENTDE